MKPSLHVRLSQHLALTPQLQQSIRLLQLSTLELHQEVEQMLEQNPFLETEEEFPASPFESPLDRPVADRVAERDDGDADTGGGGEAAEISGDEFGTFAQEDWENGTEGDDFDGIHETPGSAAGTGGGDEHEGDAQDRTGGHTSLQDHLRAQTVGMRLSDDERAALHVLIESLDPDGYLADTLHDIALRLAEMLGMDAQADTERCDALATTLRCALGWLQNLDPVGVGARSLGECLKLQLALNPPSPVRQLAMQVAEKHLDLLARRDMRRLVGLTDASEDELREAQALIKLCEPKPGRQFAVGESHIVVPDVIVRKTGRGLQVTLNPDVMPKLRINNLYAQAVRGHRGNPGQPGMTSRLQEARWFMKNILQRFDTILRVSKAIVERQKSFFAHGAIAMKPLVLREIADELGLHESTISRVTTAKYMATIHGTFELKYFFGSSLHTEAGGNASSTAVRALIQQLVVAEDIAKPLSDSQLSEMLEEQGIQVARRTVAKYREALRIAPAAQRKNI